MEQTPETNKHYVLTFFADSAYPYETADFSPGINRKTHCNILARKLFKTVNIKVEIFSNLYAIFLNSQNKCIGIIELNIFGDCIFEKQDIRKFKYNGELIREIALKNDSTKVIILEAGYSPSKRFGRPFGKKFSRSVKKSLEKEQIEFLGYHYITASGKAYINLGIE